MKKGNPATILLGLLLLWACSSPPLSTAQPKKAEIMHYILLKTGERVTIRLDPPKPGYNWYYTISEDWVISMIEPYGYPFKSGSLEAQHGAVQEQKIFEVTGLKPGKVTIRFYQMDPAREADPPSEETNYTVEVKTF